MSAELIIARGGDPGKGIQNCILVELANGNKLRKKFLIGDLKTSSWIFYENSNRNFLFFMAVVFLVKFKMLKSIKLKYFSHGDHFMPIARTQYSWWTLTREFIFIHLSDEVLSHSFTSLALIHKYAKIKRQKLTRRRFDVSRYVDLIPDFNQFRVRADNNTVCIVLYKRKNKTIFNEFISKSNKCKYLDESNDIIKQISGYKNFAVCSESESLSLIAIEAINVGCEFVYVNRRIGIKEYSQDLKEIYPWFKGFRYY